MLKKISIENFTVFAKASFDFGPGLNVIIGANSTGKSHLLKLAYAVARTSYNQKNQLGQSKAAWQKAIADDLVGIFRPENLGRLARRRHGHTKTSVRVSFEELKAGTVDFGFSTRSNSEVQMTEGIPSQFAPSAPVFIPTKELLSLFPGLRGLYKEYQLAVDETYPDLCERLDKPALRGPRLESIGEILGPLEDMIHGDVRNESGHFYLYQENGGRLEIDLVAEGLRKLATLSFLLKNGSLTDTTALFWDEPEANLNPQLIKQLAALLMKLAGRKYQIIIATHSLYLLKELHIISKKQSVTTVRYFGLSTGDSESGTIVSAAEDLEQLPDIASLEAEIEQSDRFQEAMEE